jgi:hypothetical protein
VAGGVALRSRTGHDHQRFSVTALRVVLPCFALVLDNRQVPLSTSDGGELSGTPVAGCEMGMGYRFNPPPNWPAPPPGWVPLPGWRPSPEWPAPPLGWQLWIDDKAPAPNQGGTAFEGSYAVSGLTEADYERVRRTGASVTALENEGGASKHGEKKSWLSRISARTDLRGLGVRIEDDQVSTLPGLVKSRRLGPLKGAHAELTSGTRHHRIGAAAVAAPLSLGAGLLIGLTKKSKATAFVVFADGTVHERKLEGNSMISSAQRDAVKFNALASAKDG